MIREWEYIMIHHSLTKDGQVVDTEAIWRYHVLEKAWDTIGYHYLLEAVGKNDFPAIIVGRSLLMEGAHCVGMNTKAIGVCVVGNYDEIPPEEYKLIKLVSFLKDLMKMFGIEPKNIVAHRDYAEKSCPGKRFNMKALRARLL